MAKKISEDITKDYLYKIDHINMNLSNKINAAYSGTRKSNAKGISLEFSDYRDYTMGDDLRRIDWNGYGRFDKLFLKLFMEEKQATINIFVDSSKSMEFGNPEKSYYAKMLAASLSYMALKNTDKVNIFACGEKILEQKRNIKTKNQFLSVVHFLDNLETSANTTLSHALSETKNMRLGSGLSIILSDFYSTDGIQEGIKYLQNQKQDVILIHILSREEESPSVEGVVKLIDAETKNVREIAITHQIKNRYDIALQKYKNELKTFCYKRGLTYYFTTTEVPVFETLNNIYNFS